MLRLSKIAGGLALALALVAAPTASYAGIFVSLSANFGPPVLPVYVQPPCPAPDLVWTPGYWAYGPYGYYWVPGTWVAAPEVGYYWTPGYWGYDDNLYVWHGGYWGTQVGFYGGINYGFGYFGNGYNGGGWYGDHFRYNTAYTNVNRTYVRNVFVSRTVNNYYGATTNRVSFNGGRGGIAVRPTPNQVAFGMQHHVAMTQAQLANVHVAATNRNFLANVNHGHPATVAFSRPLAATHRPPNFTPIAAHAATQRAVTTRTTAFHAATTHATTYHAPATTYHAPATTYHAPATYHAPVTTYHAPATTYHAPAAYHAPATYHAPVRSFSAPSHAGGHGPSAPRQSGGARDGKHN